VLKSPEFI
jgi:hypothetical protein